MKSSRKIKLALLVTTAIAGCSSPPSAQELQPVAPRATAIQQSPSPSVVDKPLTRLVPQPEGTPLPPRDPRVADHWPPEFKQMIDNLLSLYSKEGKPPNVEEVEKKMGIKLTERPLPENSYGVYKVFNVSGTPYANPALEKWGGGLAASYIIFRAKPPDGMRQSLNLVTSIPQSGFCLDPYELAVYTGSKFFNGDTSPHKIRRVWSGAYVWGMFEWSSANRYIGENMYIVVGRNSGEADPKALRAICVTAINVFGRYIKE